MKKKTKAKRTQTERANPYQIVTDAIIARLEQGVVPWRKPWNANTDTPINFATKRPYSGLNIWVLMASGFQSRYWLSFNQIKELGGEVIKGEKATPIIYWSKVTKRDENDEEDNYMLLKFWKIFNLDQTTGIDYKESELEHPITEFKPIQAAKAVVDNMPQPPKFKDGMVQRAFYSPSDDYINMPIKTTFISEAHYYATLFHEMAHSTGHEKRLNREELTKVTMKGDHNYSKEELVAEFTASFLCAHTEIDTGDLFENSVAYIQSWIKRLRENPKYLVSAASKAQKAANYILNVNQEEV